jgi:hypothetical protein
MLTTTTPEFVDESRAEFIAWKCLKKRAFAMPNDENPPTDSVEELIRT